MLGLHGRMGHGVNESERIRWLARVAVDNRINALLRDMPCFCTPERPELGRQDWCAKHWVLKRLDRDALAGEVQQTLEVEG